MKKKLKKYNGIVEWFNPVKGFGEIKSNKGESVFAHYTAIEFDGYKNLNPGEIVKYTAIKTEKGMNAYQIWKVKE